MKLKPFTPLILSMALALVLVILVEDFVRSVLVEPILYLIWFVTLIVQSFPQGLIWTGTLFLLLVTAIIRLSNWRARKTPGVQPRSQTKGQVERWASLFASAQDSRFSRWRLAQELKRLARKLESPLGGRENRPKIEQVPDLPPALLAYFEAGQPTEPTFWQRLKGPDPTPPTSLDLDPQAVIDLLEEKYLQGPLRTPRPDFEGLPGKDRWND